MKPTPISQNPIFTTAAILVQLAGAIMALFSACASSSHLDNTWRDPAFKAEPMRDLLVIALKKDATKRRLWEDGLVAELGRYDVEATPSYRLFPAEVPDTASVIEAVRREGYDGVLIARKLDPATYSNYVPGYTSTVPITDYNPWTNTYYTYYRQVHQPGYTDTSHVARHEFNLWTTKEGGRLVWVGTGEVSDPASTPAVREQITKMIVPELAREKLIPGLRR